MWSPDIQTVDAGTLVLKYYMYVTIHAISLKGQHHHDQQGMESECIVLD